MELSSESRVGNGQGSRQTFTQQSHANHGRARAYPQGAVGGHGALDGRDRVHRTPSAGSQTGGARHGAASQVSRTTAGTQLSANSGTDARSSNRISNRRTRAGRGPQMRQARHTPSVATQGQSHVSTPAGARGRSARQSYASVVSALSSSVHTNSAGVGMNNFEMDVDVEYSSNVPTPEHYEASEQATRSITTRQTDSNRTISSGRIKGYSYCTAGNGNDIDSTGSEASSAGSVSSSASQGCTTAVSPVPAALQDTASTTMNNRRCKRRRGTSTPDAQSGTSASQVAVNAMFVDLSEGSSESTPVTSTHTGFVSDCVSSTPDRSGKKRSCIELDTDDVCQLDDGDCFSTSSKRRRY